MRLTNELRDKFVASVLADVPKVNYDEQIRALALPEAVAKMPPPVRAVWDRPELRDWIRTEVNWVGGLTMYLPTNVDRHGFELSEPLKKQVAALTEKDEEQEETRMELRKKLRGIAYGCNTTMKLAQLLPEFSKYLPTEARVGGNEIVAHGVVDAFKRAGWKE